MKAKAKIDLTQRDAKPIASLKPTDKVSTDSVRSILPVLTRAWASYRSETGWAPLEGMGMELKRIQPGFSVSSFGPFMKLEDLLDATDGFEFKKLRPGLPQLVRRVVGNKGNVKPVAPSA